MDYSDDEIIKNFEQNNYLASDLYYDPIVSIPHMLRYMYPEAKNSQLANVQNTLESKGEWASKLVREFILRERPPERKRYIRGQYNPAKIFFARKIEGSDSIDLVLPAVRIYGHSIYKGINNWGRLVLRCPICGDIHHYSIPTGDFGREFGGGNRQKGSECLWDRFVNRTRLYHTLYEVKDPSLVGYLTKEYSEEIRIPE